MKKTGATDGFREGKIPVGLITVLEMILRAILCSYSLFLCVESTHFVDQPVKWLKPVNGGVVSDQTNNTLQNGVSRVQNRFSERDEYNPKYKLRFGVDGKLDAGEIEPYGKLKSASALEEKTETNLKLETGLKLEVDRTTEKDMTGEVESVVKSREESVEGTKILFEGEAKCEPLLKVVTEIHADWRMGLKNKAEIRFDKSRGTHLLIYSETKTRKVKRREGIGWEEKSGIGKQTVDENFPHMKLEREMKGNVNNARKKELNLKEQSTVDVERKFWLKSSEKKTLKSELATKNEVVSVAEGKIERVPVLKARAIFPNSMTNAFRRSASSLMGPGGVVESGYRTVKPFMDWVKTSCTYLTIDHDLLMNAYRRLMRGDNSSEAKKSIPKSKNSITKPTNLGLKTQTNGKEVKISSGRHEEAFELPVDIEFADAQNTMPGSPPKIKITNGKNGHGVESQEFLEVAGPTEDVKADRTSPPSPRRSPQKSPPISQKGSPTKTSRESSQQNSSPKSQKESPKKSPIRENSGSNLSEVLDGEFERIGSAEYGADIQKTPPPSPQRSPQKSPKQSPQHLPQKSSPKFRKDSSQKSQIETLQLSPSLMEKEGNGKLPQKSPKRSPERSSPKSQRISPQKKNGRNAGAVDDGISLPKPAKLIPGVSRWMESRIPSKLKNKDADQDGNPENRPPTRMVMPSLSGWRSQPSDYPNTYSVEELAAWARDAAEKQGPKEEKRDLRGSAESRASPSKRNGKPLPPADIPDLSDLRGYSPSELAKWAEAQAAMQPSREAGGDQETRIKFTESQLEQKRREMVGVPSSRFKGKAKFHDPKAWEKLRTETKEDEEKDEE